MQGFGARTLPTFSLFFVFNAILFSQAGVDPLAPTHDTKSAAKVDREWQVSVSKYDGARTTLLEVDRQENDGTNRRRLGDAAQD
jgi:hypothetical protein